MSEDREAPVDRPEDADQVVLVDGVAASPCGALLAERVLAAALRCLSGRGEAPARCEVSVTLVDDALIRDLNRTYRGVDAATDVLSFSQLEGDGVDLRRMPFTALVPLGDIVISMPRMREQAREYGHAEERELGYLLIHGLLHLLGYDHQHPHDRVAMRAAEEDLLAAAGLTRETQPAGDADSPV
jgi:probable rRNA maturation factor